jgi:hypothetical protein
MRRTDIREERSMALSVSLLAIAASLIFLLAGAPTTMAASRDETKLDRDAAGLDKSAGTPKGETVVIQKIEKEFNVSEATITGLRDQKLGFGEITIVLALAQTLPGGITTDNINSIMKMRTGPPVMGWGAIAKKLGVNLGTIVSGVHKVDTESHRELGMEEKAEHGKGMTNDEGSERMERPEGMGHEGGHGRY